MAAYPGVVARGVVTLGVVARGVVGLGVLLRLIVSTTRQLHLYRDMSSTVHNILHQTQIIRIFNSMIKKTEAK